MINIFSFFSGLGFLDLGFETTEFNIVYVNEIHKPFLEAYKYSREKLGISSPLFGYDHCSIEDLFNGKHQSHLTDSIKISKKNELVGFIGVPPCPDFSVGGKNRGRHGDNGKLSSSYINAIISFKPDFFLFENVKGLWRTKKHREFYEDLKKDLFNAGYILTERLINTIEYSAPQDRERILLFGLHISIAEEMKLEFNKLLKTFSSDYFEWGKFAQYPNKSAFSYNWPTINDFEIDSISNPPKISPLNLPFNIILIKTMCLIILIPFIVFNLVLD